MVGMFMFHVDNDLDEWRQFTHYPDCMCFFCQSDAHKQEIEEENWESKFECDSLCVLVIIMNNIGVML